MFFFFNDTATTEIYTLSLHDALPIYAVAVLAVPLGPQGGEVAHLVAALADVPWLGDELHAVDDRVLLDERSEEHTSELQSRQYLVCRLLLEKKNKCV